MNVEITSREIEINQRAVVNEISQHTVYGRYSFDLGWAPSPSYLLRRQRILELVQPLPRGRLLEVGCGAGALLADFADAGFRCSAIEASEEAARIASRINRDRPEIEIRTQPDQSWIESFDFVVAFEVLEHQEDDRAALRQWTQWVKPGGHLMISVPGHPERWNASDVWAGHYRRYDRKSLSMALEGTGCQIRWIECYGFPLTNIIDPLRARYHGQRIRMAPEEGGTEDAKTRSTHRSGIERPLEARLYPLQASWPGSVAMRLAFWLQNRFLTRDWGMGYIALASKQ